jgi:hypothetical protein
VRVRRAFFPIILLLLGVRVPAQAETPADPAGTAWASLEPIVVEAEDPGSSRNPLPEIRSAPIQVTTGFGAPPIDPYRNELGIEQRTMERLEDLSAPRRAMLPQWSLLPTRWQADLQGDLSLDQKLRARMDGPLAQGSLGLEAGFARDHREVPFLDNRGTLYTTGDDTIGSYPNRQDRGYGKAQYDAESWSALADFDFQLADLHAGPTLVGTKTQRQLTGSAEWELRGARITPFVSLRQDRFDSTTSELLASSTADLRLGAAADIPLTPAFTASAELSRETLERSFPDAQSAGFSRLAARTQLNAKTAGPWLELDSHARAEGASDQASGRASGAGDGTLSAWDAGAALSSSHRFRAGAQARLRRFALLPAPSQRFGDGALLAASPDLPPETGTRFSAGPWWAPARETSLELEGFVEQGENAPVFAAVSPTQARTLPIGGIWARGLQLRSRLGWPAFGGRMRLRSDWVAQEALNDSQIGWQRGQSLPGRPAWVGDSELSFERKRWKAGIGYLYRSQEALDLGGFWARPEQHRLGCRVGYGTGNWEARLVANNLFAGPSPSQSPVFQGSAGPNLLEPELVQTEIRLQWEVLL